MASDHMKDCDKKILPMLTDERRADGAMLTAAQSNGEVVRVRRHGVLRHPMAALNLKFPLPCSEHQATSRLAEQAQRSLGGQTQNAGMA